MSTKIVKGVKIWLPCEVRPGPFSDERLVKVPSDSGAWVGFVSVAVLQSQVETGETKIRVVVVDVEDDHYIAVLPGHSVSERIYKGLTSKVDALDIIQQ